MSKRLRKCHFFSGQTLTIEAKAHRKRNKNSTSYLDLCTIASVFSLDGTLFSGDYFSLDCLHNKIRFLKKVYTYITYHFFQMI